MSNILYLYNSTQTYTNTVYEHIASFAKHSRYRPFFCHHDSTTLLNLDLSRFDAVAIHYSIRLPYDQLSPSTVEALKKFEGLKFLFIQDEYDHTYKAWHWIKNLDLQLVFTVVPKAATQRIYPSREFPNTRFVNILTGYVPDELKLNENVIPPSQRSLMVGYRGRPLPIRYGQLGIDKVAVGVMVKTYCDANGVANDIAWTEESRIYGQNWYEFMASCRSMLGVESGSNVFDWDGELGPRIARFRESNPAIGDHEIYEKFVKPEEMHGIMNQVSPRIFEAIAAKTILVLFEGIYSGVVEAGVHFIPLKKDGSNLSDVLRLLRTASYVDEMAERAYRDVIASDKYSYRSFVSFVDEEIERSISNIALPGCKVVLPCNDKNYFGPIAPITTFPLRAVPQKMASSTYCSTLSGSIANIFLGPRGTRMKGIALRLAIHTGDKLPGSMQNFLKPRFKKIFKID